MRSARSSRLLESTCSTCGNAIPDRDHCDPDNVENVTGAAVCHCNSRRLQLPGAER